MLVTQTTTRKRYLKSNFILILASAVLLSLIATAKVAAAEVTVTLIDNATGLATPSADIRAHRIEPDGSRKQVKRTSTNEQGQAVFDLEGIESGQLYQFSSKAFNDNHLFSPSVANVDSFEFLAGSKLVTVKDGTAAGKPLLAGHKVTIKRIDAEGKLKWVTRGTSDASGVVRFNLSDTSSAYVLEAKSPTTGDNKRSAEVTATSNDEFVVGNPPVNVSLVDPITGAAIPAQRITAKQILADGSTKWYGRKDTNDNGFAQFDLNGIEQGKRYQLHTKSADGFHATIEVSAPGDTLFPFGNTRLTLLNGRIAENPPIAGTRVTLYEVIGEEKKWLTKVTSTGSGQVTLDLKGLGNGRQYLAKLKLEGKWYEQPVTQTGSSSLVFGKLPQVISANLFNTATNAPVVGEQVRLYRWQGDKKKHVSRQDTDAAGNVSFDAQGLYDNQTFFLQIDPFDGDVLRSETLNAAAHVQFNVHLQENGLTVNLVDGTENSSPLPNKRINVYKLVDGERQHYSRKDSNEQGIAQFTLPEFDQGQQYVLASKHSKTNKWVYSDPITSNGQTTFTVGESPLVVTLVNPIDNSPIANARIDAMRAKEDGGWRREARQETDANGQVTMHLAEISQDEPVLLRAKSANGFDAELSITETGSQTFPLGNTQLTLLNGRLEDSPVLPNTRVDLFVLQGEERNRILRRNSDDNGNVLLALDDLETGQSYQAKVKIDGKSYTADLPGTGASALTFGKLPQWLNISANNTKDGQPIADMRIDVFRLEGEDRKHVKRGNTDAQGNVSFDLQGFYEDEQYQIQYRPYDGAKVLSDIITEAQDMQLDLYYHRDGLPVTVLDGSQAGNPALVGHRIDVYKIIDGEIKWYSRQDTDAAGQVFLKLPDLDKGQQYVVSAKTPVANIRRYSDAFGDVDSMAFTLGSIPVQVSLQHGVTGEAIPEFRVNAQRLAEDGKFKYYQRANTDAAGNASFDLEGLGEGASYRFQVNYLATGKSYSQVISETEDVLFRVGNVPVNLVDRDTGNALSGVRVEARWLDQDNKHRHERRGNTDSVGNILFDLSRLQDGTRYVLRAKNPFGENKTYYGPIIYSEGAVDFVVKQGEQGDLDLQSPEVLITSPSRDSVNGLGFTLGGVAEDDTSIGRIEVSIQDPVKGTSRGDAELLPGNQWQFNVPAEAISEDQSILVTVTAFDTALNSAEATRVFAVVQDMEPPNISIVSHGDNDDVNETGFTIIGDASDDTGNVVVSASLSDPILGNTINGQMVSVAENGQWALIVTNGKVTGGETVSLTVTATDSSDKTQTISIRLQVQTIVPQQQQLISRITFGMTPDLYINQPDATSFLTQQLNPAAIDDSELESQLADWPVAELADLKARQLHQMLYSNRQLNEVMTWFWENHFNTNFNTHRNVAFELAENQGFRLHALGSFRDLLGVSAKSPAMIYYLNNAQNVVGRANENYAREIMELHTLGVDGGYSATDISELARIFTGWHEQDGAFFFNDAEHDFGTKEVLGVTFQGNGLDDGEQALDLLASHPSTARNICRKLITLLVSDQPIASLQGQCEGQFLASNGNIASVLQVILASSEFIALEHQANKTKTPLEVVLAAIRSVNATPDYPALNNTLRRMGYSLFEYPVPTGLAETGAVWLTSDALLQRIKFANYFALEGRDGASADLQALMLAMGYSSADAIVGVLADLTLNGRLTDLERDVATDLLNQDIAEDESFDINGADAQEKLQRLLGTMLSYPAFQYQ